MIIDCDTGGLTEHFALNVKTMERLGISAAIIEDKKGLKKFIIREQGKARIETIKEFSEKLVKELNLEQMIIL